MNAIQTNVLLGSHTTLKIGGPAKFFVKVTTEEELKQACVWADTNQVSVFILGGGSNVLISDAGFKGLVIKLNFLELEFSGNIVCVGSGVALAKLVIESVNKNFRGLEWAIGVPGVVGGAVCGNASCFGGRISDNLISVKVFDRVASRIFSLSPQDCNFGYHESVFKESPNLIILGASFVFSEDVKERIMREMKDNIKKRQEVQPVGEKSAGSFFKNVEWKRPDIQKDFLLKNFPELKQFSDLPTISTKFLIDSLGLRGKKIGEAAVSEKHANFLINLGDAKAEQIMMLSSLIKQRVYNHYGINLEEEVRLIGFDF